MSNFGDQPEHILELVNRYWMAVRKVFAEEWADGRNFILLQTIGLSGFAHLGGTLMDMGFSNARVDQKDFELYLEAVKREVDLSRGSDQWRGVAGAGGAKLVADVLIRAATQDNITRTAVEQSLRLEQPEPASQLDN
jgi:hypothetical protein